MSGLPIEIEGDHLSHVGALSQRLSSLAIRFDCPLAESTDVSINNLAEFSTQTGNWKIRHNP